MKYGLGVYSQRHCHEKDGAKYFSTTVIVFIHISYSAMAHHPLHRQLAAQPYHYQPHHCHSSLLLCYGTLPPFLPISDWLPPQASSHLSFEYHFPCPTRSQARHSNISQTTLVVFQLIMYRTTDIKIRDTPEKVHSLVSSKKTYILVCTVIDIFAP